MRSPCSWARSRPFSISAGKSVTVDKNGAQGEAEASMKYADMHRQLGETKAYLEALNVALKNAGATAPGTTTGSPTAPNRNQPISGR